MNNSQIDHRSSIDQSSSLASIQERTSTSSSAETQRGSLGGRTVDTKLNTAQKFITQVATIIVGFFSFSLAAAANRELKNIFTNINEKRATEKGSQPAESQRASSPKEQAQRKSIHGTEEVAHKKLEINPTPPKIEESAPRPTGQLPSTREKTQELIDNLKDNPTYIRAKSNQDKGIPQGTNQTTHLAFMAALIQHRDSLPPTPSLEVPSQNGTSFNAAEENKGVQPKEEKISPESLKEGLKTTLTNIKSETDPQTKLTNLKNFEKTLSESNADKPFKIVQSFHLKAEILHTEVDILKTTPEKSNLEDSKNKIKELKKEIENKGISEESKQSILQSIQTSEKMITKMEFPSHINNLSKTLANLQESIKTGKQVGAELNQTGILIGNLKNIQDDLNETEANKLKEISLTFQTNAILNETAQSEKIFQQGVKKAADQLKQIDQKISTSSKGKKDPVIAEMQVKYQNLSELSSKVSEKFIQAEGNPKKIHHLITEDKDYKSYIQQTKEIILGYDKLMNSLNEFSKTKLNKSKENEFLYDNSLDGSLILPIQRLPRYELFLKELEKNADAEGKPLFKAAMESVQVALKDIDDTRKDIDEKRTMELATTGMIRLLNMPEKKLAAELKKLVFSAVTPQQKTELQLLLTITGAKSQQLAKSTKPSVFNQTIAQLTLKDDQFKEKYFQILKA